jgi:ribonuclease BN (tRNA processing enzyme)
LSFRIIILGIGDAFTRMHYGSSALIEAPDRSGYVLIDCPDIIHRALKDATRKANWNVDASKIDDILLTHLHGDHCNGLESLGFYRRIMRIRKLNFIRPRLHAMQPVVDRLWERLAPAMDPPMGDNKPSTLDDYFDVRILDPARTATVAGLTVHCRPTKHTVPTIGFVIEHENRVFGWSGDTPFEQAHVDWLSRAQLIVHESNLGVAHTPIESLNALPKNIRDKMKIIHLTDDFDPTTTDISILREGDVLTL